MDNWRDEAPEFLVEMADAAADVLARDFGVEAGRADYMGYCVMRAIAEKVGGAQVYIPKVDSIARCARDEAIWRDFTGCNHRELARKYGVTKIHIYRIVKRMGELERERRQGNLPL